MKEYFENTTQRVWIAIIGLFLLLISAYFVYKIFHKPPTCYDKKQNQTESGIDCGGECSLQCYGFYKDLTLEQSQIVKSTNGDYMVVIFQNSNINYAPYNINFDVHLKVKDNQTGIISKLTKSYNELGYNAQYITFVLKDKDYAGAEIVDIVIKAKENNFYWVGNRQEVPIKSFTIDKVPSGYKAIVKYDNNKSTDESTIVFYDKDHNIIYAEDINIKIKDKLKTGEMMFYSDTDLRNTIKIEIYTKKSNFYF